MRNQLMLVALLLVGCDGTGDGLQPQTAAEDFFAGKTITYIVATKPGGGYDTYARLIGRYMERHLPGVDIRIRNVPGAGNIVGTNQLMRARPDGLTIGTFNTGLIYAQAIGRTGVRFDLREFEWLGKASTEPRVLMVSNISGIRTLDELRDLEEPALFAASGVGSASHVETLILTHLLDIDIRLVTGFGGNEAQMSMLRGEVAAVIGSYSALRGFVDNGSGRFLIHVGGDQQFDDAIAAAQLYVSGDEGRSLLTLIETTSMLGRLTAAPPGTPAKRLAVLRAAYAAALADPDLLAEAARLQFPISPLYGDEVAQLVNAALDQSTEVLATLTDVVVQ